MIDLNFRGAVLPMFRFFDFAAKMLRHELHAVADAQDRHAQMQHAVVSGWCVGVVDGTGATGEYDAGGRVALDFVERSRAREHDGEDILFADAARDELRVLGAKVEDDD